MTAAESPEELLARAAAAMRAEADRCGDLPPSFIQAVADLLESFTACGCEEGCDHWAEKSRALRVARAFLGEAEGAGRG